MVDNMRALSVLLLLFCCCTHSSIIIHCQCHKSPYTGTQTHTRARITLSICACLCGILWCVNIPTTNAEQRQTERKRETEKLKEKSSTIYTTTPSIHQVNRLCSYECLLFCHHPHSKVHAYADFSKFSTF